MGRPDPISSLKDVEAMTAPIDVEKVLSELNMLEKISLLAGKDFWHTKEIPRLGVPSLRFSDGPNGVRGISFLNSYPSSCFPSATGMAASFDLALAKEVGVALGDESIAKGVHTWLGPTMNVQRSPLGGRGFESFSEDPFVQGMFGSSIIEGIQSKGIAATAKHFVGNEAEKNRMACDSIIDPVTLREIYLKPFEMCVAGPSPPWAIMTGYNRVNGVHVSESKEIIKDILRDEWKWDGLVMSDWTGTYSTIDALEAGLDIEMPGPSIMRGEALLRSVQCAKVSPVHIDNAARNILKMVHRAQKAGHKFDQPEGLVDTPERRALLRKAAAGAVVVLKNEDSILPIATGAATPKSIAVIGPNAGDPSIHGGGSAMLKATYISTPLEAIVEASQAVGIDAANVKYTKGCNTHKSLPSFAKYVTDPVEQKKGLFNVNMYGEDPRINKEAPVLHSFRCNDYLWIFIDGIPEIVPMVCWIVVEGIFQSEETVPWEFGALGMGQMQLYMDGQSIVDNETTQEVGDGFFGMGVAEKRNVFQVEAGRKYDFKCVFSNAKPVPGAIPYPGRGGMKFGGLPKITDEAALQSAVQIAKQQELVVIVAGTNGDWESEGHDRADLKLPPGTDEMIAAVCEANPNTIVVMQSGMPVEMPWVDKPKAIVQAWFGGNESGHGIADVLFGKVEPSGRLPLTFPKRVEDNPSFHNFPESYSVGLFSKIIYGEGTNVGYRFYDSAKKDVLFPFGAGLSYTTFGWSDAKVEQNGSKVQASISVKNTGARAGRENVQLYVSEPGSLLKELKGFYISPKELAPGSNETAKISFDLTDLGKWDIAGNCWKVKPGKRTVLLGANSRDIRATLEIEVQKELTWTGIVKREA